MKGPATTLVRKMFSLVNIENSEMLPLASKRTKHSQI